MRRIASSRLIKYISFFCFILIANLSSAQSWQPVAGQIPGVLFTGIASVTSSPAIVVTTVNDGVYRSSDSGNTWQHVLVTQDTIFSLTDIDGQHLCAGGRGFTYTSSDSGITWVSHTFPFPIPVARFAMHPSGALIAGTGSKWDGNHIGKGVWLSLDTGKTWSSLNSGITMSDPLIESLAISPSGSILAGINDVNVGLSGKYGLMKLDSLQGSWQRMSISVDAPFNQNYSDQNLRIGSVFNINILDGQVLSSIEGVYVNFGYAFTIQKAIQDIGDSSIAWKVKWTEDSIPGTGSFYEHLVNVFKDSHDTVWGSVSDPGNEINNNIYTGSLSADIPWTLNMSIITEQTGRFLFSEGANGRLYTISYFTGDQIFVRSISTTTSIAETENINKGNWSIYPNPVGNYIHLSNSINTSSKNIRLTIFDVIGNMLMEKNVQYANDTIISLDDILLPNGIYVLSFWDGQELQKFRFVKN